MFRRTGRYSNEDLPQEEEGVLLPRERRPLQRPMISRPQSILEAAPEPEAKAPAEEEVQEPEAQPEAVAQPEPAPPPAAAPAPRAAQPPQTVIAADTVWDGTISSEGNVIIQGQAKGTVKAKENVSVEPGGVANATVAARAVRVAGAINGKVNCQERLEVHKNGRIEGEFTTSVLVIEEGAFVKGRFHMGDQRDAKARGQNGAGNGRNGDATG